MGAEPPAADGYRDLGAKPPVAGRFLKVFGKKLFKSHWITFRTSSQSFERGRFLTFQTQLKKFDRSILLLQLNSKTCLESCIMM